MEYGDFQQCLKEAELSVAELARLLRQHPNSLTNYKRLGYVPSHLAVIAVLSRELSVRGIPFKENIERLNLKPKASRGRSISETLQEGLFESERRSIAHVETSES